MACGGEENGLRTRGRPAPDGLHPTQSAAAYSHDLPSARRWRRRTLAPSLRGVTARPWLRPGLHRRHSTPLERPDKAATRETILS